MEDSRSRKTVRQFNCRDALWTIFEEMARELECSVDYLINEAMRQYAKSRRYAVPAAEQPGASGPLPAPGAPPVGAPRSTPAGGLPPRPAGPPRPGMPGGAMPTRPSPLPGSGPAMPGGPGLPPRPLAAGSAPPPGRQSLFPLDGRATSPAAHRPGSPVAPETDAFAQMRRTGGLVQAPAPLAPPPPQQPAGAVSFEVAKAASTGQGRAPLYIIFNGQRIPIRKEQFIIGRGLKTSDLAIKDTNISRRHAAVLFHNGAYYIKDLNSTNGIEYNGMRIDSKRIEEGDMFKICDYEFRFTYQ
ncbi:MAG: FHA domain-containing protein [Deltaproteobacteria bacterium]|nr:FHA domain-containing protein [Deltaproteobacteria bacterium]